MKLRNLSLLCGVISLALMAGSAIAYDNDRFVRLRYVQGDVTLHPSDRQRPNEATINSPILDGDEIETGDGRAELAFHNGIVVRLGDYSGIRVDSAYSPMTIELLQGTVFVDSRMVDSFRDQLEVRTSDAQVFLIDEGNLRVDLGREGSVRVTSVQGEAEVRASGRRVLLENGERTYVDPGQSPERPVAYNGESDELDDWNQSRMNLYADRGSDHYQRDRYVDEDIYYDSYDLDNYGDWQVYGSYGHVWVPHVNVGWRPYYDGRWVYCNSSWFWASYEPWGWAPYHYGRWGWSLGIGWYWIPGDVFAPAWVSWYDYGDYIGWCPLNFYNRPIGIFNNYNAHNYQIVQKQKTLDVTNSWTFVPKRQIGAVKLKTVSASPTVVKRFQIDEKKIVRTPQPQLVNYVVPKAPPVPAYVNEKRVAKEVEGVHNPATGGNMDDQFDRGKYTFHKEGTARGSEKNQDHGASANVSPKRGWEPPARDWEKERGEPAKKSSGTTVVERSDKRTFQDRDAQFGRPNEGKERTYPSYVSPYYKGKDSGNDDNNRHNDPWFRDPGAYQPDRGERNGDPGEVSPRYSDEARRLFERFDHDHNSAPPNNSPRGGDQYQGQGHEPSHQYRMPDTRRNDDSRSHGSGHGNSKPPSSGQKPSKPHG